MLRMGEAAAAEEGSAVPLADDFVISETCTIALCVAVEPGRNTSALEHLEFRLFLFRIVNLVFSFSSFSFSFRVGLGCDFRLDQAGHICT